MSLPVLPEAKNARLPKTYETARESIMKCERIDECKQWTKKAEALASYARQAQDATLLDAATKIQRRAWKRAGELLRQIEPKQGARTDKRSIPGNTTLQTRKDAAMRAGLSKNQKDQALRLAAIPEEQFERVLATTPGIPMKELEIMGTKAGKNARSPEMKAYVAAFHWLEDFEAEVSKDVNLLMKGAAKATLPTLSAKKFGAMVKAVNTWSEKVLAKQGVRK